MVERQKPMNMVMMEFKINQKNMVLYLSDFIVEPTFTTVVASMNLAVLAPSRHAGSTSYKAFDMPTAP